MRRRNRPFFGSSDKVPWREHDPVKAKALLADAGFPDGFKLDL